MKSIDYILNLNKLGVMVPIVKIMEAFHEKSSMTRNYTRFFMPKKMVYKSVVTLLYKMTCKGS